MIVEDGAIATIEPVSYPYSEPAFDFWRPVGDAYPLVEGKFSLECYCRAAAECFGAYAVDHGGADAFTPFGALCFHVPFPKMVKKAVKKIGESLELSETLTEALWTDKVEPTMAWNKKMGNAYTASLWFSVAQALAGAGDRTPIGAFSYGSGFGAELLVLRASSLATKGAWRADVEADLAERRVIDADEYTRLRGAAE